MKEHTFASEASGKGKKYLALHPDKDRYDKADHQIRATLKMWDQNRRCPKGLYFKNDVAEHDNKLIEDPCGRYEFQKYLEESKRQIEQIFRILMRRRDDWITANGYKAKETKPPVELATIAKLPPLEERLAAIPTGKNDYGGQINILWNKIGQGQPAAYQISRLNRRTYQEFNKKLLRYSN